MFQQSRKKLKLNNSKKVYSLVRSCFLEMYRKTWNIFNTKYFIARLITFDTNKWHFSYVSNLCIGGLQFATQLKSQMFNLTDVISDKSCQMWKDIHTSIEKRILL